MVAGNVASNIHITIRVICSWINFRINVIRSNWWGLSLVLDVDLLMYFEYIGDLLCPSWRICRLFRMYARFFWFLNVVSILLFANVDIHRWKASHREFCLTFKFNLPQIRIQGNILTNVSIRIISLGTWKSSQIGNYLTTIWISLKINSKTSLYVL